MEDEIDAPIQPKLKLKYSFNPYGVEFEYTEDSHDQDDGDGRDGPAATGPEALPPDVDILAGADTIEFGDPLDGNARFDEGSYDGKPPLASPTSVDLPPDFDFSKVKPIEWGEVDIWERREDRANAERKARDLEDQHRKEHYPEERSYDAYIDFG